MPSSLAAVMAARALKEQKDADAPDKPKKPTIPSQAEVLASWQSRLKSGRVYAKTAKIHAKCAVVSGTLETIIKGKHETSKAYKAGDYIVQGTEGERYCVDHDVFHQRCPWLRVEPTSPLLNGSHPRHQTLQRPPRCTDAHAFEPAETKDLQAEGFRLYSATGRVWAHQVSGTRWPPAHEQTEPLHVRGLGAPGSERAAPPSQMTEEDCAASFPTGTFMAAVSASRKPLPPEQQIGAASATHASHACTPPLGTVGRADGRTGQRLAGHAASLGRRGLPPPDDLDPAPKPNPEPNPKPNPKPNPEPNPGSN